MTVMPDIEYSNAPCAALLPQLKLLWRSVFGDSEEFVEAFFNCYNVCDVAHTLTAGNEVVAMLYALPCSIECDGAILPAAYLYAIAVREDYRGRGLMRQLVERSEASLRSSGVRATLLVPADEGLFALYERLGYSVCARREIQSLALRDSVSRGLVVEKATPDEAVFAFVQALSLRRSGAVVHTVETLSLNLRDCEMSGGGLFVARVGSDIEAVAFVAVRAGRPVVLDSFGGVDACEALLCGVGRLLAAGSFDVCRPGAGRPFAMVHRFDDCPVFTELKAQMMLDV